jgi:hypothetical protein
MGSWQSFTTPMTLTKLPGDTSSSWISLSGLYPGGREGSDGALPATLEREPPTDIVAGVRMWKKVGLPTIPDNLIEG